jgi:hypothetical protein
MLLIERLADRLFNEEKTASRSVWSAVKPSLEAEKLPISDTPTTAVFGQNKFVEIVSVSIQMNRVNFSEPVKILFYNAKSMIKDHLSEMPPVKKFLAR